MDAEELFKEHHEAMEITGGGWCDQGNYYCIYPVDSNATGGSLDLDNFTVTNYEVVAEEYNTETITHGVITRYKLIGNNERVYLSEYVIRDLLELFDKTIEDLKLYKDHDDFPVMLELDDPDWNAMIAPRVDQE